VLYRIAGELVPSGGAARCAEVEETLKPILPGRLVSTFERDGSCDFAIAHPELGASASTSDDSAPE